MRYRERAFAVAAGISPTAGVVGINTIEGMFGEPVLRLSGHWIECALIGPALVLRGGTGSLVAVSPSADTLAPRT